MKKYIIYTLILSILALIPIVIIEIALRQIPNRYTFKAQYMEQHCDSIDILILGNSHAYMGINPEKLSPNAYNLANVSQSLDYDYYLLEKYISRCPNLNTVYLNISIFDFYALLKNTDKYFLGIYRQAFDIFQVPVNLKYCFEVLYGTDIFQKLKNHYIDQKDMVLTTAKGLALSYSIENKVPPPEKASQNAQQRANSHNYDTLDPFAIECFKDIITLCKGKNLKLIIVTTPVTQEYANLCDRTQYIETIEIIDNELQNIPDSFFVNYFEDFSWSQNEDYFFDADHLTPFGADAFTLNLKQKVENILATK